MLDARVEKLLFHATIALSRPTKFNDPFDCQLPLKYHGTDNQWCEFFERQEVSRGGTRKAGKRKFQEMLKRACTQGGRKQFFAKIANEILITNTQKVGVCCFSVNDMHPLMWAHYARSHTGVAIGIDVRKLIPTGLVPWKITYQKKLPELKLLRLSEDRDQLIDAMFGTKGLEWDYEEERRLIRFPLKSDSDLDVKSSINFVDSITFGCRCEDTHISKFLNMLGPRKAGLQIRRAKQSESEFALIRIPLDKDPQTCVRVSD